MVVLPAPPHRGNDDQRVYEDDGPSQPFELTHDGPANRGQPRARLLSQHATWTELQDVEEILAELGEDVGMFASSQRGQHRREGTAAPHEFR